MNVPFDNPVTLENDRARLEPLQLSHLPHLLPIALQSPNLLQYSPSPFGSEALLKQNIETAVTDRENQTRLPFAIYDKAQNAFAGSTSFGNISIHDKRLEIGWTWLGTDFQGTRLNYAVKKLLLTHVFETLEFERVEFRVDSRNLRSQAAVAKIGATFEGELRSHTLMRDGYRRNTRIYSIIKAEWPELKQSVFQAES